MKSIDTLVPDILEVMENGHEVSPEDTDTFGSDLSRIISDRLSTASPAPSLRMSNLGEKCNRKLWYKVNHPEWGEKLSGVTKLKFLLGDVWEAVLLFLARVSGHKVEGQQDVSELHGVIGHRDAVVDGMVVDVKSASSRAFTKFADGLTTDRDDFGYLVQLDGYLEAAALDPLVTIKDEAAFLAGDKTLGKITLDRHKKRNIDYETLVREKREAIASETPPPRGYPDVPFGKSGNRSLGTACSYCEFKEKCWPGLKTYVYSSGPKFLTVVKKEPRVDEKVENDPF